MALGCISARKSCADSLPLRLATIAIACSLSTGCVSVSPRVISDTTIQSPQTEVSTESSNELEQRLRDEAETWTGTPYVLGGTTRDGVDCSAFVRAIYNDVLGVSLPRTTIEQSRLGLPVVHPPLKTGDLVFYRIDPRTRHVGVYLGNDEFLHASKSEGITISSIRESYWQKRFWTVRRILEPQPVTAEDVEPDVVTDKGRISW